MEAVEAIRARYRPERIITLFVGESAPAGGGFFYSGDSAIKTHMQRAVETALGESKCSNFLDRFKAYGWYLDDLVLKPVNNLKRSQRMAECRGAQNSLKDRIVEYRPLAIVSLVLSIKDIVEAAAISAGNDARRYAVPFPGQGHQGRFQEDMARIIRDLPRLP